MNFELSGRLTHDRSICDFHRTLSSDNREFGLSIFGLSGTHLYHGSLGMRVHLTVPQSHATSRLGWSKSILPFQRAIENAVIGFPVWAQWPWGKRFLPLANSRSKHNSTTQWGVSAENKSQLHEQRSQKSDSLRLHQKASWCLEAKPKSTTSSRWIGRLPHVWHLFLQPCRKSFSASLRPHTMLRTTKRCTKKSISLQRPWSKIVLANFNAHFFQSKTLHTKAMEQHRKMNGIVFPLVLKNVASLGLLKANAKCSAVLFCCCLMPH